MSTLKKNITSKRFGVLAAQQELLFHTGDLAALWGISIGNTLRTLLKRYAQQGLIHRVYRGLYSLVPLEKLDPLRLGAKALHQYCYLSTESVLFEAGIIGQKVNQLTFISPVSRSFELGGHQYLSRQMDDRFLYLPNGVELKDGIYRASVERAVADMLYYNPWYHFDQAPDWEKVRELQQALGYPLTPHRYAAAKS